MSLIQRVASRPVIAEAVGDVITRPDNTTAYTAGDAIANSATDASVAAFSIDTAAAGKNAPVRITRARVETTDTGAANTFRVYIYNADPTASSGVVGADNEAFSNKRNGLVGTLIGEAFAMSDGKVIFATPEIADTPIICTPESGTSVLYWQLQTVDGFTPIAESTWTITLELEQGV